MSQTGNAIDMIRKYEDPKGYFLAFSGGKDSIVTEDLIRRAGVAFQGYFQHTTVDPPELILFIKQFYPEIEMLYPPESMFELIVRRGLPTRVTPWCSTYLKKWVNTGQIVVTGLRRQESFRRSKRKHYEQDHKKTRWYLNPILSWSSDDVWRYIRYHKLVYPSAYDNGSTRIGCIGCPMAYYKTRQKELNKYPQFIKMYKEAIRKRMEKGFFSQFKDEEDVYNWWVGNLSMANYLSQSRIDFKT